MGVFFGDSTWFVIPISIASFISAFICINVLVCSCYTMECEPYFGRTTAHSQQRRGDTKKRRDRQKRKHINKTVKITNHFALICYTLTSVIVAMLCLSDESVSFHTLYYLAFTLFICGKIVTLVLLTSRLFVSFQKSTFRYPKKYFYFLGIGIALMTVASLLLILCQTAFEADLAYHLIELLIALIDLSLSITLMLLFTRNLFRIILQIKRNTGFSPRGADRPAYHPRSHSAGAILQPSISAKSLKERGAAVSEGEEAADTTPAFSGDAVAGDVAIPKDLPHTAQLALAMSGSAPVLQIMPINEDDETDNTDIGGENRSPINDTDTTNDSTKSVPKSLSLLSPVVSPHLTVGNNSPSLGSVSNTEFSMADMGAVIPDFQPKGGLQLPPQSKKAGFRLSADETRLKLDRKQLQLVATNTKFTLLSCLCLVLSLSFHIVANLDEHSRPSRWTLYFVLAFASAVNVSCLTLLLRLFRKWYDLLCSKCHWGCENIFVLLVGNFLYHERLKIERQMSKSVQLGELPSPHSESNAKDTVAVDLATA